MTVRIEYDEAVQMLREIVAEKGEDYVYVDPDGVSAETGIASCMYFTPDGAPSCIVGHVLARKGVAYGITEGFDNSANVYGLVEVDGFLDVEGETYDLLRQVQDEQDGGAPWGVALQSALHA